MYTMDYKTETLVEVAYKEIKKDIVERMIVPGQKIIIRELYERYGISETPIKQALNRLVTEGLVESMPRKGMKLRKIEWEEIEEMMDIRFMIETYYIKEAMLTFKNNDEIKEKFSKNISEHRRIIENITDVNEYFKNYNLDQEFHQLFIKCSGNKRATEIYNNLGTHIYSYYVYGKQAKSEMILGVKEHESIYNALKAQDKDELLNCIEIHLRNAKNNVCKMFK